MTFAQPHALWLLALGVPIILVHFYRGRIRRLQVPTLLFWDQILVEEERASALKRLRHWLTLVLALVALALVTSALADPVVRGLTPEARPWIFIVDTASELGAREPDGRTRLELACAKVEALVAGLYRRSPVALYDAQGLVEVGSTDREAFRRALALLPRVGPERSIGEIMADARVASPEAFLCVLTARTCVPLDANTRIIPVGTPRANRALRSLACRDRTLSAVVANEADEPVEVTLVLRNRGRVLAEEPLRLAPRESRRIVRLLEEKFIQDERFDRGGLIEMALLPEDAYPADDAVHAVVPPLTPPLVVVVSQNGPDPHVWSALRMLGVQLVSLSREEFERKRDQFGEDAVVIFDRVEPVTGWGAALFIACGPMGAEQADPKLLDWDRRAPVLEHVGFLDVLVRRAHVLEGEPLIMSDRGPVAVVGRSMGRAWIQIGFGLGVAEGDFALKSSFPIFLRNVLTWLADEGRRAFPREAIVGSVVVNQAPLPEGASEATVTTVLGTRTQSRTIPVEGGEVRISVDDPGLMKIVVGGRTEWLAARLDRAVDLEHLPVEAGADLLEPLPWWRGMPYGAVVGIFVTLVLLVEWWLYQTKG